MLKVVRFTGWTLITVGVVILLYLVYLLFFTNMRTDRAQQDLLEDWSVEYGDPREALPGEGADNPEAEPADPGSAYAVMWFERPGSDDPVVHEDPLYVVEGVTLEHLKSGPGHYPETGAPGSPGNFAISGHRTTYGAPFYNLDELRAGDQIHVVDRGGAKWVYEVVDQRIVGPRDVWVIGDDPLGTGAPTMTLTTCHPRFSAAQRLIVFAELLEA